MRPFLDFLSVFSPFPRFYGKEIAVGDLRHSIAEMKKLPKASRSLETCSDCQVDLQIVNGSTGEAGFKTSEHGFSEVYPRDGHLLSRNVIVTVRRTPIQTQKRPQVLNLEGRKHV